MPDTYKPRHHKDIETAVRWAMAERKSLEVIGHGTKRAFGRSTQYDAALDLSEVAGVTLYEPEELVLSARAGTPLSEIKALIAQYDKNGLIGKAQDLQGFSDKLKKYVDTWGDLLVNVITDPNACNVASFFAQVANTFVGKLIPDF